MRLARRSSPVSESTMNWVMSSGEARSSKVFPPAHCTADTQPAVLIEAYRAVPGIEPWTSRTRSENHTPHAEIGPGK